MTNKNISNDFIKKFLIQDIDKCGLCNAGIFSLMLALESCQTLYDIGIIEEKNTREIIKKIIFNHDLKLYVTGNLISLLNIWYLLDDQLKMDLPQNNLKEELKAKLYDKKNQMDTIDQIKSCFLIDMKSNEIEGLMLKASLELDNARLWKYELVDNPFYCRKIHGSFHYTSPFLLFYYLSKYQCKIGGLKIHMKSILDQFIMEGYENFDKLHMLNKSLLLAATPSEYSYYIKKVMNKYKSEIMEDNNGVLFYYENMLYSSFLGSEYYELSKIIESIVLAGTIVWKPFKSDSNANTANVSIAHNELRNIELNSRYIMRMKVKNHCMAPCLEEGDEIDVSFDFSNIALNDILVFRHYEKK